jgi:hypothetical protein
MNDQTQTPPRLVISWIDSDGDVSKIIGDFADRPRGRLDAPAAEINEILQVRTLREMQANEALSLVDHVPDPDAYNACADVRIERVLSDDRQELLRLPNGAFFRQLCRTNGVAIGSERHGQATSEMPAHTNGRMVARCHFDHNA